MKKIFYFTLMLSWLLCAVGHAQTLDLQSYFPAPYGAYDRLRLVPQDHTTGEFDIDTDCLDTAAPGVIVVVDAAPEIRICSGDDTSAVWTELPGVWTQTGSDIYPTDSSDDIKVGIGTDTPSSKLHVESTTDTVVTIQGAANSGVELWESGTPDIQQGSLTFDSNSDLILRSNIGKAHLKTSGGSLTVDTSGWVGINQENPNAVLEIVPSGSPPSYLRISSAAAQDGDIFDILSDRRTFINVPSGDAARTAGNSGMLLISWDEGGGNYSRIGFLHSGNDVEYNGGSDNIARFVHKGGAGDELWFRGNGNNLAKLSNAGMLHISEKLSVGKVNASPPDICYRKNCGLYPIMHDQVELHLHEKSGTGDVVALMSDGGTNTGVNDGNFAFIEGDTIGAFMPVKDLWGSGAATTNGGLMITGIHNGGGTRPNGLSLIGLLGLANPGDIPAVEIDGTKISGGALVNMSGSDVVLGINYSSNTTDPDPPANSSWGDGTVFLADGRVGIGFDYGEKPDVGVDLHVRDTLRIHPRSSQPFACGDAYKGALFYYSTSHTLCFCNGTLWTSVGGGTGICP